MREIAFTIDEEGEIHLEVHGVSGPSCDEFTLPFETELGLVIDKTRKTEYFDQENHTHSVGDTNES